MGLSHLLLTATFVSLVSTTAADGPAVARVQDASDPFFALATVPQIRIRVDPAELARLKAEPRQYVKASIREDGQAPVADVGVKLKGAAGSFREWEDRPALTINVPKFQKSNRFHDLAKFHLNNSVQDETYLNEILCADLFRQAGIPAPRVGYARVWLNDRDVGLYLVKEGFDRPFLRRWFPDSSGNLYDGGFLQDLDADLEKDEGSGPDDRRDLKAVVEATREPDPERRRERLEALVDIDQFCAFMAMERMTGHWDGYSDKANNYRLYFDPQTSKAIFLPHGMDQMFSEPEAGLFQDSDKIVAAQVLRNDILRRRYRERVAKLVGLMAPADGLLQRVDEVERRIKPTIEAMGPEVAARHSEQVASLKQRLVDRAVNLRKQVDEPEALFQKFDDQGVASLANWAPIVRSGEPTLAEVEIGPGLKALRIEARGNEPAVGSWRQRVMLPPGHYLFQAEVRAEQVVLLENNEGGIGLGRSGVARTQHLDGTVARKLLTDRFQVGADQRQVELVLELRARSGSVWFSLDSVRLIQLDRATDPADR